MMPPSGVFIVAGVPTALGTQCVCGGALSSHSQLAPHACRERGCVAFRRRSYDVAPSGVLARRSPPSPRAKRSPRMTVLR